MPSNVTIRLRNTGLIFVAGVLVLAVVGCSNPEDELKAIGGAYQSQLKDYGARKQKTNNMAIAPSSAAQVQKIFALAKKHKLKITFRGAGHSMSGQSIPCTDSKSCIIVYTSQLKKWDTSQLKNGRLIVGAGVLVAKLYEFNKDMKHGWVAPVLPDFAGPSIGGYLVAGGLSSSSFRFGGFWDNVIAFTLVTTDGQVHKVKAGDDLFKYSFGGFGRLGLITELVLKLSQVPKQKIQSGSFEASFASAEKWLAAAEKIHRSKNAFLLIGNFNEGTVDTSFQTTGNPNEFIGILQAASIGSKKMEPQKKLKADPTKSFHSFNLLCPHKRFMKCFKELDRIKKELEIPYSGHYATKIKNTGSQAPLVHNYQKDFWHTGFWIRNLKETSGTFKKLRIEFEKVRLALGIRSYISVEEIPPGYDFAGYYGQDIWGKWQSLQQSYMGQQILKDWPPFVEPPKNPSKILPKK